MKQLSSLNKGLVLHQKLDKESYNPTTLRFSDKTPYSNHGTAQSGNFTTDRMGHSNEATVFNGTSDYVDCGVSSDMNFATGDFTYVCWFKVDDVTGGQMLLSTAWTSGGGGASDLGVMVMVNLDTNKILCISRDTLGSSLYCENSFTDYSSYHSVVFMRQNQTLYAYLDNQPFTTNGISGVNGNFSGHIRNRIGTWSRNPADKFYTGSLDDVRIYNRALSEDEIALLYESYKSKVVV